MSKPIRICCVDGCENPVEARGWCRTHYSRWRRTGVAGGAELLRKPSPASCKAVGCVSKTQALGYCNAHYMRLQQYGDAEYLHNNVCEFCSKQTYDLYPRKYCSKACAAVHNRHAGERPVSGICSRCGGVVDLMAKTRAGRIKRADTRMCLECKRGRSTRHGWSVKAIVKHHGTTDCGICGELVDTVLRRPNMMSPSIDHIIPYAHGGSNAVENLQLAHLHCNHVKSDSGWKRGNRAVSP